MTIEAYAPYFPFINLIPISIFRIIGLIYLYGERCMADKCKQINQHAFKELTAYYRQYAKEIGMGFIVVLWLSYSAFALGLNILTDSSGLQCTHHIEN